MLRLAMLTCLTSLKEMYTSSAELTARPSTCLLLSTYKTFASANELLKLFVKWLSHSQLLSIFKYFNVDCENHKITFRCIRCSNQKHDFSTCTCSYQNINSFLSALFLCFWGKVPGPLERGKLRRKGSNWGIYKIYV